MIRAIVAFALAAVLAPSWAAREPIRIGWTAWADGVFVTHLAERLIERRLDQPVELVRTSVAEQYQGVADGRIDLMLMSWQPRTHAPYVRRIGGRVEDLGVLYDSGRLGWAVPDYVPVDRVESIADLAKPEVRRRMQNRIVGIDPGSGLMRLSHQALNRYGLDGYTLESGSGPAMSDRLGQAVEREDWVVVTAWSPHWLFAAYDLRYLDDPQGMLGDSEQVHALARSGFYGDHPAVGRLLNRLWLSRAELEAALLDAHERSTEAAVDRYISNHPERVTYWVQGEFTPETR